MLGPIFNREFLTVPRRSRHYALRVAYLGGLWVVAVTVWLRTVGWQHSATLGETARLGQTLFQVLMLYVQLPLFLFFAALSSASAIAQEKDRRTFVLLLITLTLTDAATRFPLAMPPGSHRALHLGHNPFGNP